MKAITLWQPYATLIALGAKQYETRSWSTPYRGKLAIHAAAKNDAEVWRYIMDYPVQKALRDHGYREPMPFGAVVCIAELVVCHRTDSFFVSREERNVGNFAPGRWAWELKVIELFDTPILAKGAQGLWNWDRR